MENVTLRLIDRTRVVFHKFMEHGETREFSARQAEALRRSDPGSFELVGPAAGGALVIPPGFPEEIFLVGIKDGIVEVSTEDPAEETATEVMSEVTEEEAADPLELSQAEGTADLGPEPVTEEMLEISEDATEVVDAQELSLPEVEEVKDEHDPDGADRPAKGRRTGPKQRSKR